jgi:hypothetical protein
MTEDELEKVATSISIPEICALYQKYKIQNFRLNPFDNEIKSIILHKENIIIYGENSTINDLTTNYFDLDLPTKLRIEMMMNENDSQLLNDAQSTDEIFALFFEALLRSNENFVDKFLRRFSSIPGNDFTKKQILGRVRNQLVRLN